MSWPLVKLKDCCQVVGGATPKRNVDEYWSSPDVPWVTPKDVSKLNSPVLEDAPEYISNEGFKKCAAFMLPKGSVLVTSRAPIGNVAIAGKNMCTNQGFKSLIPGEDVDGQYLYYCMLARSINLQALGNGATFKEVSKKTVEEFEIPLPPLDEQKRIAAILDKADAIRRKRQQAIDLADDFLRSIFLDMFGDPVNNPKGWEKVSMADFGTFKNGLNFGRDESGNSLHCLGVGNFKSLDRIEDVSALPKVELNKLPAEDYLLKNDDLVFVRSNGNKALVGRCVTMHPGEEKVTFSGFCIRYRIENIKLDANFLNLCLRIPSMKNEMLQGGQGANIQNINQKLLSSLNIPLPPIAQQKRFSDLVATFRLLLTKKQNSLKSGSELFNSLSQKAFAGEL